MNRARLIPLPRLLAGYHTSRVEPKDDGSVLIHVESEHPDLLLATFAVSAETAERLDLRPFDPKPASTRERNRLAMARRRAKEITDE